MTISTIIILHYVNICSLGPTRLLKSSDSIMDLMSKQPQSKSYRFELRHKKRSSAVTATVKAADRSTQSASGVEDRISERKKSVGLERDESILSHLHSLENKNRELQRQLDSMELQLLTHKSLEETLSALQESYASLSEKYQQERETHKESTQQLQLQLDEASLARRQTEEQLLLTGSASESGVLKESQSLLEDIQAKYSDEVSNLVSEIRVKDKTLQETRNERIALVRG